MSALVKVGSFTKSTSGAPVSQAVTGIGFQPMVLICFTSGGLTQNSFHTGQRQSFGFTTGPSESFAQSASADDNAGTMNTCRRLTNRVVCIVNGSNSVLAQCSLTSFDSDGFTLNWTTNDANATIINYIALAGSQLTNAKAFSMQKRSGTGSQSVTGMGFQPEAMILAHIGNQTGALEVAGNSSSYGIGMATDPGFEFAMFNSSVDAAATSDTLRLYREDAVMCSSTSGLSIDNLARLSSWDSDGFTLNWNNSVASQPYMIGLCLAGGDWRTYPTRLKPTSTSVPVADAFSDGETALIMMGMVSNTSTLSAVAQARMSIGATDGTDSRSMVVNDADAQATSVVDAADTSYLIAKVNNSSSVIQARASFVSFDHPGFTIQWDVNDAVATMVGVMTWSDDGMGVLTETDVVIDGVVKDTITSDLVADGVVQDTLTSDVVMDALVVSDDIVTEVTDVIMDGFVLTTPILDLVTSGIVFGSTSLDLVVDGSLIDSTTAVTMDLVVSGTVRARHLTTDVVMDAYVSTGPLGGRLVSIASGDWHTPGTWVYADSEETRGTLLVHPRYAREFRFTPESDYDMGGFLLPVACDSAHDPGGTLTLQLGSVSGDTLTPITTATLPATARVASAGVEYFHVRWSSPQSLTDGTTYYVRVLAPADNIAPMVVATARDVSGIASYVLNGIVVTTTPVTSIEPRSVVVAPLVLAGVRSSVTVTFSQDDASNYRTVYVTPGAHLVFNPGVTTRMGIDKVLSIGAEASVTLAPTGSYTAKIMMTAADAGILVNGEFSCAGTLKSQSHRMNIATIPGETILFLDDTPTSWLNGDRVLVQTNTTDVSQVVTLQGEMLDPDMLMTVPITRAYAVGTRVVNLSRSVQISGLSLTSLASLRINAGASVDLSHVELRYFGPAVAVAPHDLATVDLLDVVIAEGAILNGSSGPTGLIPGALTTCEDIVVYKYKTGVVLASGRTVDGTLIVADTNVAHTAIIVQGESELDAIGIGINGSLVNVWAGGRFTGTLENHWGFGPGASLVSCVSGVVDRLTLSGSFSGVNANGAAIYVGPAGGLGYGLVTELTTDRPVLLVDSGTNYVGQLVLRNCTLDEDQVLVRTIASAFVHVIDEDGIKPEGTALVTGSLVSGSKVAIRTRTEEVTGYRERCFTQYLSGSSSLRIHANTDETHVVELGRFRVTAGETLRISGGLKGNVTLRLRNSTVITPVSESFNPGGWSTEEIEATAFADGVIVFEALTTSDGYLDQMVRV